MNDSTGTEADPATYIIGHDPSYLGPKNFAAGAVNISGSYNKLVVQNGILAQNSGAFSTTGYGAQLVVTGSGSALSLGGVFGVGGGNASNNTAVISNGARLTWNVSGANTRFIVGSGSGTNNSLVIDNAFMQQHVNNQINFLGYGSSNNQIVVTNSGTLQVSGVMVTGSSSHNNGIVVTGSGSLFDMVFDNNTYLRLGVAGGTNNYFQVEDGAMFRSVATSFLYTENNYIRLDNGYFVLRGNQVAKFTTLIEEGYFQLKKGDEWVVETNPDHFTITHYASAADAAAATGYSFANVNGGWTVITGTALIPEAGSTILLLTGTASYLLFRRGRRKI